MTSSISGFFGGGGKGITWPETPGGVNRDGSANGRTNVIGIITAVHKPEEIMDPKDGKPTGKMQVRIELDTDERDPDIPDDDGARTLYVKSYMRGAIADAMKKAGVREPEIGARLTVTFTHTEPPERAVLSPSKHFEATYVSPGQVASSSFFGSDNGEATAAGPMKPDSIPQAAWDAMSPTTKQAVNTTMAAMPVTATNKPPF